MIQKVIISTVIALAFTSQLVTAGSITDTYTTGDTLTATMLNNIKTAVNDNDASKQELITGSCSSNSAISGVNADGSVNCQTTYPATGFVSVSAVVGRPDNEAAATQTVMLFNVAGITRGTSAADSNIVIRLLAPLNLPEGASVTSFSFRVWDVYDGVNGSAILYRDDGTIIATATSSGNAGLETATVGITPGPDAIVDNSQYGYFVQMESLRNFPTGQILPINATVGYVLP